MKEKLAAYAKTEKFQIVDTLGVPHPYCLTPKHVEHAADHFGGMLDEDAIKSAEKAGARCDICRKSGREILPFAVHRQVLLVAVKSEGMPLNQVPGLQDYLLSIRAQCERDGYVGFAFTEVR